MQAIRTKYLAATNTRGSRIQAKCAAGQVTVEYDHALNSDENHRAACIALMERMEWDTPGYKPMVGGCFDGAFYWVFVDDLNTQGDSCA